MAELLTIGHGERTLDAFLELIDDFEIAVLADIRRFPGSRRHPQFNREALAQALSRHGVRYVWFEALGGRRRSPKGAVSPNAGLRNSAFRSYADYMQTDAFRGALEDLLDLAVQERTAVMCSETLFWRCHRRLLSDLLFARGVTVKHILGKNQLRDHQLTPSAHVRESVVEYPAVS